MSCRYPGVALFLVATILLSVPIVSAIATVHEPSIGSLRLAASGGTNNSSVGKDPSSNSVALCPSAGPLLLGIRWSCVAILNLTELGLILATVGIIAYVFRDSDKAELPGEASEIPVTAEEQEEYRQGRQRGVPYRPSREDPEKR